MPTITGWIAVADVSDGQTFTRYYSTASTGGSISTTQGTRKYFYDALHSAAESAVPPTSTTVFSLLIGTNGTDGDDAPRFSEIRLYTNPAVSSAPSAPTARITWSTGAIDNITSGWSREPPTAVANSTVDIYSSTLLFIDTAPPFTNTTATGSTPIQSLNFEGLVTFSSGDFAVNGGSITNIDGGNIITGSIQANALNVNGPVDISNANGALLAGRQGTSDFGTSGFYVGRTSTNGTTADGFQLSSTSVVDSNTLGEATNLGTGVVQALIHDESEGLRLYEPIFYQQSTPGQDTVITASGTHTLAAGELHTITVVGGGGGGGGASSQIGGQRSYRTHDAGDPGSDGSITSVTVAINGTTTTYSAPGGAGAPGQNPGSQPSGGTQLNGVAGDATVFGPGGDGGTKVYIGSMSGSRGEDGDDAPSTSYGAGGGGGGGNYARDDDNDGYGWGGFGGGAAPPLTIVVDTTGGSATATLTITIGAGGTGGDGGRVNSNASSYSGYGGDGASGAVAISGIFDGYDAFDLSDIVNGQASDREAKDNIRLIEDPIETIKTLNGYRFNYIKNNQASIGLMVDEVEPHFPEVVSTKRSGKRINYSPIIALAVEAIKAQQVIIDAQQTSIDNLITRVTALEPPEDPE